MRSQPLTTLLCTLALGLIAACGDDEPTASDGGTLLASGCTGSLLMCGVECVDPRVDPEHCGGCETRCEADELCERAQCVPRSSGSGARCDENETMCGQTCADTTSDIAHCGGCDRACAAGERCVAGECGDCESSELEELSKALELSTVGQGDLLRASCAQTQSPEVVVAFTAPEAGRYLFNTRGSNFNTVLYALDGACGGEELGCDDDAEGGLHARLELELEEGQRIAIAVEGFGWQSGDVVLTAEPVASRGSCCSSGDAPGCDEPEVEACVCAIDELCCTSAWDDVCAQLVRSEGCGECGATSSTCEPAQMGDEAPGTLTGELSGTNSAVDISCGFLGEADTLFAFTAPSAGTYSFSTEGSAIADTVLGLFEGTACDGAELACNDDDGDGFSSRVTATLEAGQEVLIAVESWDAEEGSVEVHVEEGGDEPAACEPTALAGSLPVIANGTATTEGGRFSPACAVAGSSGETLYTFTASEAGRYRFDTRGSEADTILLVLDGDCDGEPLDCNDDSELGGLSAVVDVDLTAGQSVTVVVDSYDGIGDYELSIAREGEIGQGESQACCASHASTGCEEESVQACVCAVDDYCCTEAWDELCVDAVSILDCGQCL